MPGLPSSAVQRQGRKNVSFRIGENVLVHREFVIIPEGRRRPCNKLRPRWYGPFEIIERIGANAYRLQLPHTLRCHRMGLKKHFQSTMEGRQDEPLSLGIDLDGHERFIVEEMPVLDHRRCRAGLQYLVLWKGYYDATWAGNHAENNLNNEVGQDLVPLVLYKQRHPH